MLLYTPQMKSEDVHLDFFFSPFHLRKIFCFVLKICQDTVQCFDLFDYILNKKNKKFAKSYILRW